MKKHMVIAVLILIPLMFLGAAKLPYASTGTYLVKLINVNHDDFFANNMIDVLKSTNEAHLIDSKPDELSIAPELEKLEDIKYGSFKLGNNEKEVWFVMGKDAAGYYSQVYIDQDLDNNITVKEKVPDLDTFDRKVKGIRVLNASAQWSPIPITVSYKGLRGEIKKKVYFYLWTSVSEKKNEKDEVATQVSIATVSVMEGLIKVVVGQDERLMKFRLMDADSNGCFNDYGKDVIYMDLNFDGTYSKNECQPLYEFFDVKMDNQKKQMRFVVLPYPAKVQVIEATQDFDAAALEPEPDKNEMPSKNN